MDRDIPQPSEPIQHVEQVLSFLQVEAEGVNCSPSLALAFIEIVSKHLQTFCYRLGTTLSDLNFDLLNRLTQCGYLVHQECNYIHYI